MLDVLQKQMEREDAINARFIKRRNAFIKLYLETPYTKSIPFEGREFYVIEGTEYLALNVVSKKRENKPTLGVYSNIWDVAKAAMDFSDMMRDES